ncbi:hypothetical protein Echvi_1117 [Echinicola vietnamensis DSM 17526]|uniref:Uncharacterized protein n=1 Tax=Echinicola vietnamensis (strain DSM 17526 / LMG 23754 / KMM 6221) TaxID=926556 RepID=L0FWG7_ECHVK|nr:hypothetical protein Echvi_1117 [Echinicola vietnamensis DSM 17526]
MPDYGYGEGTMMYKNKRHPVLKQGAPNMPKKLR